MKKTLLYSLLIFFSMSCATFTDFSISPKATFSIVQLGNGKIGLFSDNAKATVQVDFGDSTVEIFNFKNATQIEHQYKSNANHRILINEKCQGEDTTCDWELFWSKDVKISDLLITNFDYRVTDNGILKCLFTGENSTKLVWNFGDDTPITTGDNPQHEYSKSGQYKVTLTASNDKFSGSISKQITIIK